MAFQLPPLKYSFNALEPHIDAKTMEIHYTKHHYGYTNKLNIALEGQADLLLMSIEEILSNLNPAVLNLWNQGDKKDPLNFIKINNSNDSIRSNIKIDLNTPYTPFFSCQLMELMSLMTKIKFKTTITTTVTNFDLICQLKQNFYHRFQIF